MCVGACLCQCVCMCVCVCACLCVCKCDVCVWWVGRLAPGRLLLSGPIFFQQSQTKRDKDIWQALSSKMWIPLTISPSPQSNTFSLPPSFSRFPSLSPPKGHHQAHSAGCSSINIGPHTEVTLSVRLSLVDGCAFANLLFMKPTEKNTEHAWDFILLSFPCLILGKAIIMQSSNCAISPTCELDRK